MTKTKKEAERAPTEGDREEGSGEQVRAEVSFLFIAALSVCARACRGAEGGVRVRDHVPL